MLIQISRDMGKTWDDITCSQVSRCWKAFSSGSAIAILVAYDCDPMPPETGLNETVLARMVDDEGDLHPEHPLLCSIRHFTTNDEAIPTVQFDGRGIRQP